MRSAAIPVPCAIIAEELLEIQYSSTRPDVIDALVGRSRRRQSPLARH